MDSKGRISRSCREYQAFEHLASRLLQRQLGIRDGKSKKPKKPIGFTLDTISGNQFVSCGEMKHDGCINALSWNYDGSRLLTGSDDRQIKLWSVNNVEDEVILLQSLFTRHRHNIFQNDFLPNSQEKLIVSCSADGSVRLSDVECDAKEILVGSCSGIMHGFVCVPGEDSVAGSVVWTAQGNGEICRYDVRENWGRQIGNSASPTPDNDPVKALARPPSHISENLIAVGLGTPVVQLHDIRCIGTGENIWEPVLKYSLPNVHPNEAISVSSLKYSKDGHLLLVNFQGYQICEFQTDSAQLSLNQDIHSCSTVPSLHQTHTYYGGMNEQTFLKTAAYFGPCDEYIVSGSDGGIVFIWDRKTKRIVNFFKSDSTVANGCIPHPSFPILATYGIESVARIWYPNKDSPYPAHQDLRLGEILETNLRTLARVERRSEYKEALRMLRHQKPTCIDIYPDYPTDLTAENQPESIQALEKTCELIKNIGNSFFGEAAKEKKILKRIYKLQQAQRKYFKALTYSTLQPEKMNGYSSIRCEDGTLQHSEDEDLNFPCEDDQEFSRGYSNNSFPSSWTKHTRWVSILGAKPVSKSLEEIQISCLLNQAACFLQLEDSRKALDVCNQLLQIQPENVKGLFRRGCAFLRIGEPDAAISDLTKANSLAPEDAAIRKKLAEAKQKKQSQKSKEKKVYQQMFKNSN